MITQNGQSVLVSPDKSRSDDAQSDDEDNEEICVDETDDMHTDVSSANQLKNLNKTGKLSK